MGTPRHFTAFCCHDTPKQSSFASSCKPQEVFFLICQKEFTWGNMQTALNLRREKNKKKLNSFTQAVRTYCTRSEWG